jgi:hypothetical protein
VASIDGASRASFIRADFRAARENLDEPATSMREIFFTQNGISPLKNAKNHPNVFLFPPTARNFFFSEFKSGPEKINVRSKIISPKSKKIRANAAGFGAAAHPRFGADSPAPLHFDDTLAARRGLTARSFA